MDNIWLRKTKNIEKFKHSYSMDYNYDDIYKFYVDKYGGKMPKRIFKKLCADFNQEVANIVITESFEFKLPFRLGSIRIKTGRLKIAMKDGRVDTGKMGIDWGASHKLWREEWPDLSYRERMNMPDKPIVVHTNDHSNGYVMRWYWDRRLSNTKNQSQYIFRAVKGGYIEDKDIHYGKRGLSSWIKNDDRINEYFE